MSKNNQNLVKFNSSDKSQMIHEIKKYFDTELEYEIGQFDAEFLLNFMIEKIGPKIYNQAIQDAKTVVSSRFESIEDDLYTLEK